MTVGTEAVELDNKPVLRPEEVDLVAFDLRVRQRLRELGGPDQASELALVARAGERRLGTTRRPELSASRHPCARRTRDRGADLVEPDEFTPQRDRKRASSSSMSGCRRGRRACVLGKSPEAPSIGEHPLGKACDAVHDEVRARACVDPDDRRLNRKFGPFDQPPDATRRAVAEQRMTVEVHHRGSRGGERLESRPPDANTRPDTACADVRCAADA